MMWTAGPFRMIVWVWFCLLYDDPYVALGQHPRINRWVRGEVKL